jgi:hypothetical protein
MIEQSLLSLLTLPFMAFCVMIMLVTKGFKHITEFVAAKVSHVFPDKYEPWWVWFWKEVVLPGTPLVIGGLAAYFVVDYPYPDMFAQSEASRVVCGVMAGVVSGWIYPRVMFYYKKFGPSKVDTEASKIEMSVEEKEPTEG